MHDMNRKLRMILMLYKEKGIIKDALVSEDTSLLNRIDANAEVVTLILAEDYKENSVKHIKGFSLNETEESNMCDITSDIEEKIMSTIHGFNCDNLELKLITEVQTIKGTQVSLLG